MTTSPTTRRWGRRPGWELVRSGGLGSTWRIRVQRQRWPAGYGGDGLWWDWKLSLNAGSVRWSLYRFRYVPCVVCGLATDQMGSWLPVNGSFHWIHRECWVAKPKSVWDA